jgi:hypothetical protein
MLKCKGFSLKKKKKRVKMVWCGSYRNLCHPRLWQIHRACVHEPPPSADLPALATLTPCSI